MHPLKVDQPYPYRQWWVAAYASELTREPLGRTILGKRVVLYRTEAGAPAALAGLCPHRGLPLEFGTLDGDDLVCGYHGFRFAPSGKCVDIPSQATVPASFCTRRYPVAQRGDFVWIWTGPADMADEALIPDLFPYGVGNPDWYAEKRPVQEMKARYLLLLDNLMDLTHVSFIHATSIVGGGAVVKIPPNVSEQGGRLKVERKGLRLPSNPLHRKYFPHFAGEIDRHFDSEFIGPCLIRTAGEMFRSDTGEYLGAVHYLHAVTPIDAHSSLYFILGPRDFQKGDAEFDKASFATWAKIQPEDQLVLERIEQAFQAAGDEVSEISARSDTPGLKVRLLIERQIKSEA